MKYIFDFDDVLFDSTGKFKERIYQCLAEVGVARARAEEHYKAVRDIKEPFSLKNFLSYFLSGEKIERVYEDIMSICLACVNQELLRVIRELGKANCFLVTNGDTEFQLAKIDASGVSMNFAQVYTVHAVSGSKKEIVEQIYSEHPNDIVIFIDDKPESFEGIDMEKCQNLKKIPWDKKGFQNLQDEIRRSTAPELRRMK